jgi:hypothetical protein
MIPIIRFHEMLLDLQADVNSLEDAPPIEQVIVSPTEAHLVHKLKDSSGIVLAVKMADSDTDIKSPDNYSENNHCLFYLLEKVDPGEHDNRRERDHYAKMQHIAKLVKEWLLEQGLNGNLCAGDETLSKPFRTEWEYQYEGHNGLSISFDLKDFSL